MKLNRLEIEGFRSLRHIVWKPGDLNILIGPNAGGKSNLLNALELLSVAAQGELSDHVLGQGGIYPQIWDGDARTIGITLAAGPIVDERVGRNGVGELVYRLELAPLGPSSGYIIENESLDLTAVRDPTKVKEGLLKRDRHGGVIYEFSAAEGGARFSAEAIVDDEALLATVGPPLFHGYLDGTLAEAFCRYLSGWKMYQDFRTDRSAPVRRSIISRWERTLDSEGVGLASVLHSLYTTDESFERDVSEAMSAAYGEEFVKLVFPPDADQRVQLKVRWKSLKRLIPASELSDGTLRFLYLIAVLCNPNPPPLIAIDEPETGLHPRMLQIVAEMAATASERTQVILTTHSAEFLDAFGESSNPPTVQVVECHDGQTQIKMVDEIRLTHWLKEYRLGELYRTNQLETMT